MKVIKSWQIGETILEIAHETGNPGDRARWEFRINGEIRIYGTGTPRNAREAIFTRRNLASMA